LFYDFKTSYLLYFAGFSFVCNWLAHQCILHRYITHKVIVVKDWLDTCFNIIAVTASVESPHLYRALHLAHHRYADTNKDVHGPFKGWFSMHKTLLSITNHVNHNIKNNKVKFLHDNYYTLLFIFLFALTLVSIDMAIFYCFTVYFWLLMTDLYNYVNHTSWFPGNYRNFDTKDNSHNNLFIDWWSGTWHNNHHKQPSAITDQVMWYEFDPIYLFFIKPIKLLQLDNLSN
jgi:stearoyl-CoA desaturase (delta-9 desaturase)